MTLDTGLKWLTNASRVPDGDEDRLYRMDKVIGPPMPTPEHTAEELTGMGMVGIYLPRELVLKEVEGT